MNVDKIVKDVLAEPRTSVQKRMVADLDEETRAHVLCGLREATGTEGTPPGFVMLATWDDDLGLLEAKAYIKEKGLTPDDVSLVRENGFLMVRRRR